MKTPIWKIRPTKEYSLQEVVDNKFIQGVESYTAIYNLVMDKEKDHRGKRKPFGYTSQTTIKARQTGNPWSKINGKLVIKGMDIILFRKANNLI